MVRGVFQGGIMGEETIESLNAQIKDLNRQLDAVKAACRNLDGRLFVSRRVNSRLNGLIEDLGASIAREQNTTNLVLVSLGQALVDAGISGMSVRINRRSQQVSVIRKVDTPSENVGVTPDAPAPGPA